jgi:hypothetical protein
VAIATGNNSIYVIESLLLSGLILSGILSEQVIVSVDVEIRRDHAIASSQFSNGDHIIITNFKNRHLFCIEIGEWIHGDYIPIGWLSHLKPKQTVTIKSTRVYKSRGIHSWSAIAIATQYPFGFARKIRFKLSSGERIVWPPFQDQEKLLPSEQSIQKQVKRAGTTLQQNEVRPMLPEDDFNSIVWTLSSKGSDPVVRMRRSEDPSPEVVLDIRCQPGPTFEKKVSSAALPFYRTQENHSGTLIILGSSGKKILHGRIAILNKLAVIQAESQDESPKEAVG